MMRYCRLLISLASLCSCYLGTVACSQESTQNLSDQAQSADKPTLWRYYQHLRQQPLQYQPLERSQLHPGKQAHYTLISQQWSPGGLVKPITWKHRVTLYYPKGAVSKIALLVVNSGRDTTLPAGSVAPGCDSQQFRVLAQKTATVVFSIDKVPNQPLIYNHDAIPRFEDNSIAHSC